MISEIEIKSLQTLKGILDNFRASMYEAEKNLKEIDEKYKAIIDKEKKSYKQIIAVSKKEIDFWEKPIIKRYGKPLDELLSNPEETAESEDENDELPFSEEEKVVDKEAELEVVAEEPIAEEIPEAESETEPVKEEVAAEESFGDTATEEKVEADDDWETATESEAQEEKDDDGWGTDFPKNWK